jgi:hypothetical protein
MARFGARFRALRPYLLPVVCCLLSVPLLAGCGGALAKDGDGTDWETMEFDPGVAEARAEELGIDVDDPVKDAEDAIAYYEGSVAELDGERERLEAELGEIAAFVEILETEDPGLVDTYVKLAEKDESELEAVLIKLGGAKESLETARARLAEVKGGGASAGAEGYTAPEDVSDGMDGYEPPIGDPGDWEIVLDGAETVPAPEEDTA